MMYWILLVMGAAVSVVTAVIIGGLLVPATYTVRRHAAVAAPPASVLAALRVLASWPVWMALGRTAEPVDEATNERVVTVAVLDDDRREIAQLTLTVAAQGRGSLIEATETGRVGNPVVRLLRHYVTGHHAVADAVLQAIAAQAGGAEADGHGAG